MTLIHEGFSSISGVLYAEDFDEPTSQHAGVRTAGPLPPAEPEFLSPSFTLDELRAATEHAHAEGREAERLLTAHALDTQRVAVLTTLAEQLSETQQQARRTVEEALDGIAQTALSLFAVALPALCANHAEGELRSLLRRLLPPTRQFPELHIRVHPSLREAIEDETKLVLEGSGTQVTWTESIKLAPGDIAIAWQNGGALRDTAATCSDIAKAILTHFGSKDEKPVVEIDHAQ